MCSETEACWRRLLGRLERLATEKATRAQMLGVLDCLDVAITKLQRAVFSRGQPALDQVTRFGRRYDDLWCRGAVDSHGMRALSGEFISWMGQTAGDAWAEYLRDSLHCIQKLKGLDLGPEVCGAGECDPAFAAFLSDINRQLAADLLSCAPPCDGKHGRKRPPPPRERPCGCRGGHTPQQPDSATPYKPDPEKGA